MAKTFHWSGFASARFNEALFSIANTGSRNQRITVQRCNITPLTMAGTFSTPCTICPFHLAYITEMASDGGIPVAAVPHVPGATLSSQVRIEMLNPSVTVVAGSSMGRHWLAQWDSNAGAITGTETLLGVAPTDNRLFSSGYRDSNTQGFTLPEGYGISICPGSLVISGSDSSVPQTIMFWATVIFKDGAGRTFTSVFELTPGSRRFFGAAGATPSTFYGLFPPFTLFNGAGSGTTITVLSINWNHSVLSGGTSANRTDGCRVQLLSTKGDAALGEILTPVASVPGDSCSFLKISRSRLGAATMVKRLMPAEAQERLGLNNGQFNPTIASQSGQFYFAARSDGVYRMTQPSRLTGNTLATEAPSMTQFGERHCSLNTQGFVVPAGCGFACMPEMECIQSFNVSDQPNSYHAYWVELTVVTDNYSSPVAMAYA